MGNILEVRNLKKYYPVQKNLFQPTKYLKAVDGVSFAVERGTTLGIVGESGCGKSTLAATIARLLDPTEGEILLEGKNIANLQGQDLSEFRQNLQLIFQDPYSSLNPRFTVQQILEEPLLIHKRGNAAERRERVVELLDKVGLSRRQLPRYPHEFSGGQRQRIGIARALALEPQVLICDEPVSALDVSIQSQILNLLRELQQELQLTMLFISHDLSVVKHISDRILVMYLGKVFEEADTKDLFNNATHPYSKALLSAIPVPNPFVKRERIVLEGDVPSPIDPPAGCAFHDRCPYAFAECSIDTPFLQEISPGHFAACHLVGRDK